MSGILVIGTGECGVRAAFALRDFGFQGAVKLIGEEAALPYERPPLSKGTGELKPIRPASDYDAAGIELRFGTKVSSVDSHDRRIALETGEEVAYEKLLIATGASARVFTGMEGCLTLRTNEDAEKISSIVRPGARIGIIGGGFIGLELAATARAKGADVSVIEGGSRFLARAVPNEIADVVSARHKAEGVLIDCGVAVERADARHIAIAGGIELSFDAVIAGVCAVPNIELAEKAGLTVQNGIAVDDGFRTSDPHIFAAGDCCNFAWRGKRVRLESWKAAQDQGVHAAATMLGAIETYDNVPRFWSDQYDLTLQVAGLFDLSESVTRRATASNQCIVFQCDQTGRLIAAAGIGPANSVAKDIRIFEKLIEKGAEVDSGMLADPAQNLKRLLRAA